MAGALARPVSLVRVGRKRRPRPSPPADEIDEQIIACQVYRDGHRVADNLAFDDALRSVRATRSGFVWLGLFQPSERVLESIADSYDLHPLAVEDAVTARQRPKLEQYDAHLFMAMKTVCYVEHEELTAESEVVDTGELMVFAGEDYIVTVRHGRHGELVDLRARLDSRPDQLRHGPAAVLHAICDQVVDDYLDTVERIQVDIDEVEATVFGPARNASTEKLYQLKREILELKHAVQPLAVPMRSLTDGRTGLVDDTTRKYFRDVADHLEQVTERITHFDELLSSLLQATLTQVSIAQNEDMRRISAWVAIAAVPTAIAGIYGMNFEHMPELREPWGYPAVLSVMATACVTLFLAFKRNGWL